jgi:hypothetical protein
MNWYELADQDEVRQILIHFLGSYGFMQVRYMRESEYGKVIRVENPPKNGYEIAEALWGEYSGELFN